MNKVSDINNTALNVVLLSSKISYAAVVDSDDNEVEITETMIEAACVSIDDDQVYPFARAAIR